MRPRHRRRRAAHSLVGAFPAAGEVPSFRTPRTACALKEKSRQRRPLRVYSKASRVSATKRQTERDRKRKRERERERERERGWESCGSSVKPNIFRKSEPEIARWCFVSTRIPESESREDRRAPRDLDARVATLSSLVRAADFSDAPLPLPLPSLPPPSRAK